MKKHFKKSIIIISFFLFSLFALVSVTSTNNVDANMNLSLDNLFLVAYADEECDLCVVKNIWGKVIFSCRQMQDEECEKSGGGYSVYCNNAIECEN